MDIYKLSPEEVANTLLQQTTTKQDSTVDVHSALTRLKYDKLEVSKQIEKLVKDNTTELLKYSGQMQDHSKQLQGLEPELLNVRQTNSKLESDFLIPYAKAKSLHSASMQMHETAKLSRQLSQYIQLALQVQSSDLSSETLKIKSIQGTVLLRTAVALKSLSTLSKDSELLRINAVAKFESTKPALQQKLIDACIKLVKEHDGKYNGQVKLALLSLKTIGYDSQEMVKDIIKQLVTSSAQTIAKSFSSQTSLDFSQAVSEARNRELVASSLVQVYQEVFINEQQASFLGNGFWPQVSQALNQRLKTMAVTNNPALKTMLVYKDTILQTTQSLLAVSNVLKVYMNR